MSAVAAAWVGMLKKDEELLPHVQKGILQCGEAAVPHLVEVLRDEELDRTDAPGGGMAPVHAAHLLGELRAVEAVPPLIEALGRTNSLELLYDAATRALEQLGTATVEPLLRFLDEESSDDAWTAGLQVLSGAGVRDDRIFDKLMVFFEDDPSMAASFLAEYGDERALGPLREALAAVRVGTDASPYAHQDIVEYAGAIEQLCGELTDAERAKRDAVRARRHALREA